MGVDKRNGQAYDVLITALNFPNELRCQALDGVSAGFIERLPATSVLLNFDVGQLQKRHMGLGVVGEDFVAMEEGYPGENGVLATGQGSEHGLGLGRAGGFPEDLVSDADDGICSKDDVGGLPRDGLGLLD